LRKIEIAKEMEVNSIKEHYETLLSEIQEKERSIEQGLVDSLHETQEKDRQRIEELSAECEGRGKEIDYLETIIRTFKLEFKPFYDKYIKTHNKSFDTKSSEKKYIIYSHYISKVGEGMNLLILFILLYSCYKNLKMTTSGWSIN
jgi:hypothetical protein